MNNKIIFAIGLLAGAGIGSVATYFGLKSRFDNLFDQEIEDYANRCTERINDLVSYYEGGAAAERELEDSDDESEESETPEPEEYRYNEGVKKYHHYANSSDDNIQSVFSKDNVKEVAGAVRFKTEEEKVTEGQKDILKRPQLEDVPGIEELDADEYDNLDDDRYTRVYLQYDVNEDKLFTNEGDIAEEAYAKQRHELIGNAWRWATDYIDKSGSMFYIENDNMMIGFAIEVIFDPNAPMVEV